MSSTEHTIGNPNSQKGRQKMRAAADKLAERYGMTDAGRDKLLREAVEDFGGDPSSIQQKAQSSTEDGPSLDGKVEELRRELQAELETPETVDRDAYGRPKERLRSRDTDDLGRER